MPTPYYAFVEVIDAPKGTITTTPAGGKIIASEDIKLFRFSPASDDFDPNPISEQGITLADVMRRREGLIVRTRQLADNSERKVDERAVATIAEYDRAIAAGLAPTTPSAVRGVSCVSHGGSPADTDAAPPPRAARTLQP